jgi:oligoribonuclease NrnB/cAMP/cGMP phosphodiesterase (DHH superfamily)
MQGGHMRRWVSSEYEDQCEKKRQKKMEYVHNEDDGVAIDETTDNMEAEAYNDEDCFASMASNQVK